jgi:predicted nucleic acid-binding protein
MSAKEVKNTSNDKRLVVYVSQEIFNELEHRSSLEDRSVSNYTRNLIIKALDKEVKND